ncbi:hypothetical protein EDD15DRAFT_2191019 [Pisolithus albus]|nr:hypothetical protein EDD15DRAFT_2191019 [Pisolithus albus]
MSESERLDAKLSEIHEPDLATLSKPKKLEHVQNHKGTRNVLYIVWVGGRRTVSRQGATTGRNSTRLREIIERLKESWENVEERETAHSIPRYSRFRPTKPFSKERLISSDALGRTRWKIYRLKGLIE